MDNENKVMDTKKDHDSIEEIDNILEAVPEEKREVMRMAISSIQMGGMISSENSIAKKITEEHITQFLDGSKSEMEHSYEEKKQNKIFTAFVMLIAMVFVVVIIILLKDKQPDVMEKIVYSLLSLVAGALGGYGYAKSRDDD